MKTVVLSNTYGTPNMGDVAILKQMLADLRQQMPQCSFTVLSWTPEHTKRHYGVNAVMSGPIHGTWSTIEAIRRADLLIIGGGGILQDLTSIGNVIFHLSRAFYAYVVGTPVMYYSVGVGPLRSSIGRRLTGFLVDRGGLVTVRDRQSMRLLEELGVQRPRRLVMADPVVNLVPSAVDQVHEILSKTGIANDGRPLVILSLRDWFHSRHNLLPIKTRINRPDRWPNGGRSRYLDFIMKVAKVANYCVGTLGARTVFVSMWPGRDDAVAADVIQHMQYKSSAFVLDPHLSPEEVLGIIGQAQLVIAMRLHAAIFAATSLVPFVVLEYHPEKQRGFVEMLGIDVPCFCVEQLHVNTLTSGIERVVTMSDQIRSELSAAIPPLGKKARLPAKLAAEMLGL